MSNSDMTKTAGDKHHEDRKQAAQSAGEAATAASLAALGKQ